LLAIVVILVASRIILSAYVAETDPNYNQKPYVDGAKSFYGGIIREYGGKVEDVTSPILTSPKGERVVIGKLAQMNSADVAEVLNSAKTAWAKGRGIWPQMSAKQRIESLEKVVVSLKEIRSEIIKVLMWEICKNADDAAAEFDRTMTFIDATIAALRESDKNGSWKTINGILSRVRRAAIGIMLCLGPFNYPFNETYATLIPALLAGNIIIMKIPNTGGLAHILTMAAYAKHLPPGTINFFSGSGRETVGPLMATGDVDVLAFIGGSKAADQIIKSHPHPHRLKVFLQLEGKNMGIVMPDADLATAVEQITLGSTSYNGQRCTAIKLILLHESIAVRFIEMFKQSINQLKWGLPWESGVLITPLPEKNKVDYLKGLLSDAVSKGAKVINELEGGGEAHGNLMRPAVVFPIDKSMRLWHEEQFGPVIPIATYRELDEVFQHIEESPYGQQAAVFSSHSSSAAPLLDVLSTAVGRVNFNTQCGRSPDVLPFSGRKSSALGTMSVSEALNAFSIETVVAGKLTPLNEEVLKGLDSTSKYLLSMDQSLTVDSTTEL